MSKKIKKFLEEIEPTAFLVATFILFLLISYIIFTYFKEVIIFSNPTLNLISLIIFYSVVYFFLISLYCKIFKFTLKKDLLTKVELKKILERKKKYREKTLKKENRIPQASMKKLKQLVKEGDEINKELNKGVILFKSYIFFLFFSIYYGLYIWKPIWAIKNSLKFFPKALKNLFKINKIEARFAWNKYKKNKDTYYYTFYIPPIN